MSLRVRLALANAAVFSLCLLAVGVGVHWGGERLLREDFDRLLTERARQVVQTLALAGMPGEPPTAVGYVVQVRSMDGQPLQRSSNLGNVELPLDAEVLDAGGDPVLSSVRGQELRAVFADGSALRVITLVHDLPGTGPAYVQVGVSEQSLEAAIQGMRRALWITLPFGLVGVLGVSWWFAGRALTPVSRVVKEIRRRGEGDLEPLPVPSGRDEFTAAVEAYNGLLARIRRAFETERRFTAHAAHELRSPVSRVFGRAQVLRQRERSLDEHRAFALEVEEEMRTLGRTVESLLVLARTDAAAGDVSGEEVWLGELLREAFEKASGLAGAQLRFRLDLPDPGEEGTEGASTEPAEAGQDWPGPEAPVQGDPELLRVAIENLLRNAITHSPAGGVVEIGLERQESEMLLRVRDHGPGFPEDQLPWRFERFRTGPNSAGTGLGLALVRGVAQRHGGHLEVGNHPEGGARCVLSLPVVGADAPGAPPHGPSAT